MTLKKVKWNEKGWVLTNLYRLQLCIKILDSSLFNDINSLKFSWWTVAEQVPGTWQGDNRVYCHAFPTLSDWTFIENTIQLQP